MARVSPGRARVSSASLPSEQELSIMRNYEHGTDPAVPRRTSSGRGDSYAMSAEEAIGAASLMERSQVVSPLAGMPVAAGTAEFGVARDIFGRGLNNEWDDYWQDDQEGYDYANLAGSKVTVGGKTYVRPGSAVTSGRGRQPAPISLIPTSTINPDRPRTVAAGYDAKRMVLTTVFRDGTFYNYYDVDGSTWLAFKQAQSKGRFIEAVLDSQPRGAANMGSAPVYAREQLYRVARTGQIVNSPDASGVVPTSMQFDRSSSPRINPTASRPRNSASKPNVSASKPKRNGMRKG